MTENSSSLSSLCNFVRTDVGATLMGKTIRIDESGVLLSVQDAKNAVNAPNIQYLINQAPSKTKGVSWKEKQGNYEAKISINGKQICLGRFPTESAASAAYDKIKIGLGVPGRKPPTSQIIGVSKHGKKWVARARYQGGPRIILGSCYETDEDAGAAILKFQQDGKPPLVIRRSLDINVCPGPKDYKNPCGGEGRRGRFSFHDEHDELLGICCSKVCLDGRYQSPAFLGTEAKYREGYANEQRATRRLYCDMMEETYQVFHDADNDVPFTLQEQKANADRIYTGLIHPLTAKLQQFGIAHQCAFGIQYSADYRAKTEGLDLLRRTNVNRNLARCGVIAKATRASRKTASGKSMVSMVIVSCNPGRSLIKWESEMQRRCLKDSRDGALNGMCLMFERCDHGGGAAVKYADLPWIRSQLVLSCWVPNKWKATVEEGFVELVAAMEKEPSFPDVLRGQLMPATDDHQMGMDYLYAKYEKQHRTLPDAKLKVLLECFKRLGSKSKKRVQTLQRIIDERSL